MNEDSFAFKALIFYGTRMHHRGKWKVHEVLRNLLKADIDRDMEVDRGGLRWILNPSDYVQRNLFWLGERDRWDTYHIKRLLPPGAVICDVGANFGYYSLSLAAFLNSNGRVFAFEPHPKTRTRLERNIALNRLGSVITVVPFALSDAGGFASMSNRKGNTGAAHVSRSGDTRIELTTLDSFCAQHQPDRLDFAKIDVEGFETRVIRGGEHFLKTFHPILLVELMPEQLERAGSTAAEVVSLLRDYGYELYVSNRKHLELLTELPIGSKLINVFCLPADRAAQ